MSIESALTELKRERARLDRAIEALEKIEPHPASPQAAPSVVAAPTAAKRGHLTEAGRRRLSELAKQRWAEKRKQQAAAAKNGKGMTSAAKTKSGKPSHGSRS